MKSVCFCKRGRTSKRWRERSGVRTRERERAHSKLSGDGNFFINPNALCLCDIKRIFNATVSNQALFVCTLKPNDSKCCSKCMGHCVLYRHTMYISVYAMCSMFNVHVRISLCLSVDSFFLLFPLVWQTF